MEEGKLPLGVGEQRQTRTLFAAFLTGQKLQNPPTAILRILLFLGSVGLLPISWDAGTCQPIQSRELSGKPTPHLADPLFTGGNNVFGQQFLFCRNWAELLDGWK